MIVTKAYITELPEKGDNLFKVNVPLMSDNTGNEAIFTATLSGTPGNYHGLSVGDCVFVTYEDDKYNDAIILGKLFVDEDEDLSNYGVYNSLKVTGSAILPTDTRIGNFSTQDLINLYNGVGNGTGGGSGSINPEDLEGYVQWTETESDSSESLGESIYADHIQIMSGAQYDALIESSEYEEHTLYFLTSPRPSEDEVNP